MVEIVEKDYEKLKWRIDKVPFDKKCIEVYPELGDIFLEFLTLKTDTLSNDMLIRFIIFCYHRNSPYIEKITNPIERKVAVFNYLKIEEKNGAFPSDIQSIVKSISPRVAKMIYQFCKFEDSLTYFALVTTTEVYIQMNEQLGSEMSSAKDSKDTADVLVKLEKIEDRIDKLSSKLFKQDIMLKDFIGSVLVVEGRKKKITAEDWAD